jgi:hypothetical protein
MSTMTEVYANPKLDLMLAKLCEGDIGGAFDVYLLVDGVRAASIISHANTLYRANLAHWTISAFAQNYLETLVSVVEPHVGAPPAKYGQSRERFEVAQQGWYCAAFDKWADIVRAFAFGEGLDL